LRAIIALTFSATVENKTDVWVKIRFKTLPIELYPPR